MVKCLAQRHKEQMVPQLGTKPRPPAPKSDTLPQHHFSQIGGMLWVNPLESTKPVNRLWIFSSQVYKADICFDVTQRHYNAHTIMMS